MEQARAEGNAIIDSHQEALDKVFEDHKAEALRQSETRIKAETTNAKLALNQALAKSQLEIKRKQGKIQQELKDKIFEEAQDLIHAFMKTEAYDDFLIRCIHSAVRFDEFADIVSENQRRGHHAPKGKVALVLLKGQAPVADL